MYWALFIFSSRGNNCKENCATLSFDGKKGPGISPVDMFKIGDKSQNI